MGRHAPDRATPATPLAITGIGCRFPGGDDPRAFWKFLCSGHHAIGPVPGDRWDAVRHGADDSAAPGKTAVTRGAFLDRAPEAFDAAFFGITPREAETIDPQHRLLMEVAWEAMEDGGLIPADLAGTDVGVYVGVFTVDSMVSLLSPLNRRRINSHTATAATMAIAANRLSYLFDFRGPSVTMDTACSSSLVAFHHACQAVWRGECPMALVGGVNFMVRPEYTMAMSKGQFLAPDGRCKSFDAAADGYGRGEGAGMVVVRPLADARRDGDRVYAVVHGTGVNQDGRTPGISAPSGTAQERLIRRVLDDSGLTADRIAYVEAHGTGTPLGDPTECRALGAVFGQERGDGRPCLIGSVKAAINHLEAGAGIAGVIKTSLALHHGLVPPQAGLDRLNPAIPFDDLNLEVVRGPTPLAAEACAGINSFGYGGTNAHALLGTAPATETAQPADPVRRPLVLPLSARDSEALPGAARRLAALLIDPEAPAPADICHTAALRRSHHDHRAVAIAGDAAGLAEVLTGFAETGRHPAMVTGRAGGAAGAGPVFVYTGMGPQWWAMGRELYHGEPVFRAAVEDCDAAFREVAGGWSVRDELLAAEQKSNMSDTRVAQTANLMLQVGLTALWESWGIRPAAVVGHSIGEVAAAWAAGALTLEEAATVAFHRSRLQKTVAGQGGMLALGVDADRAAEMIAPHGDAVSIAAINAPASVTLAGDTARLTDIAEAAEQAGLFQRFLKVEVPYHSPVMTPLEAPLTEALAHLKPVPPTLPLYSTVTGARATAAVHDGGYWARNMRDPVRFADAARALIRDGHDLFIEVGPHPVLATSLKEVLAEQGAKGLVVASMNRRQPEQETLMAALARLHVDGAAAPEWAALLPPGRLVTLPPYAWQHQSLWLESPEARQDRLGDGRPPLPGRPADGPGTAWESEITVRRLPWLADHRVDGSVLFPGAGYAALGLAVQADQDSMADCLLEDLRFEHPLVIDTAMEPLLRTAFDPETRRFTIHSRDLNGTGGWVRHARGRLAAGRVAPPAPVDLDALRAGLGDAMTAEDFYVALAARGLDYGPAFRTVQALDRGPGEVLATLATPEGTRGTPDGVFHPAVLDGCFQAMIATLDDDGGQGVYVPVAIQAIRCHAPLTDTVLCHGRITGREDGAITGDLMLTDPDGRPLMAVAGLRCQALAPDTGRRDKDWTDWIHATTWLPAEPPAGAAGTGVTLVLAQDRRFGDLVADALTATGRRAILAAAGDSFGELDGVLTFRWDAAEDARALVQATAPLERLVVLAAPGADDPAGLNATAGLLGLIQAVHGEYGDGAAPGLFLVTRGAAALDDHDRTDPAAAALVGLARVALAERPDLPWRMVDLPTEAPCLAALVTELDTADGETEVALRPTGRFVPRLGAPGLEQESETPVPVVPGTVPMVLERGREASLDGLHWRAADRRTPGPDEVEIEIKAVPLNFKDVLKVLDVLDANAYDGTFHGADLGMEAAGVITRVGPGVTAFKPGDRILTTTSSAFRSHLTTSVDRLFWMPMPEGLDFVEAAPLPTVYLTALHALHDIARVEPGERVLIHAGAGGVGQAAIQVARWLGAEIFATAGTEAKRALLRDQGVAHVFDSRTLDFADAIRDITRGRGVDVVLNSIAGDTATRSLDLLAPWGRFIEIGKRDFVEPDRRMDQAPFNRALTYVALDMDRMMAERPERFRRILRDLSARFAAGDLGPLPYHAFDAHDTGAAFRLLAQSRNVGKVVVRMDSATEVPLYPARTHAQLFNDDGWHLVTGGLGGFGLAAASWLVDQGARHLILAGRRGRATPGAAEAVRDLEARGATVRVAALDVADGAAVEALIADIAAGPRPLAGVFHAAGVLDDGLLDSQDPDRFARVMAPKALGAWHLHQATARLNLTHFVLFSSVSALLGNPGQGAYAAANAFLDALAHHRRRAGLAALSVNWGALAEVGMAARDANVLAHLTATGVTPMAPDAALAALGALLRHPDRAQTGIMQVDWGRVQGALPALARQPRFAEVIDQDAGETGGALAALPAEERPEMAALMLAEVVAEVLHVPAEKIARDRPLTDMGIDSLMTVELQTGLAARFGVEFTAVELMRGPSLDDMAALLLTRLDLAPARTQTLADAAE